MKRIICIRFVALFVLLTMILSACSDKNKTEDTDLENKPEENRYINCAPQYGNPSVKPTSPSGTKTSTWTWEDYLKAKEESGFTDLDNWQKKKEKLIKAIENYNINDYTAQYEYCKQYYDRDKTREMLLNDMMKIIENK
jgi:hypothetical protein